VTWRRVGASDRTVAALWAAAAAGSLALRPLLDWAPALLPRCFWHAVTGLPCPTCGTTRAAVALLHGHPWTALSLNPLTGAAGCAFLLGGALVPAWVLLNAPVPVLDAAPRLRVAAAVVLLANWAYLVWAGI
jgi:hypothetical protein